MSNENKEITPDKIEDATIEAGEVKTVDLSSYLSQPTGLPPNLMEGIEDIEPEEKNEEIAPEFEKVNIDIDLPGPDEIDVKEPEKPDNPKPNIFNSSTVALIIANSHHAFLPPARLWIFKKTFFKAGEFEKAQEVNAKVVNAATTDEQFKPTDYEKRLLKSYKNYCNYRDNKIELSQTDINNLEKAWEWQLKEWGFDNVSLGIHPLAEAYGSLLINDGLNVIETNFKN